jgi:predicted alpha/beta-fold hydrolase
MTRIFDTKADLTGRPPEPRAADSLVPPPFRPPWWLRAAHAQTIGGKFLRPDPGVILRRERIATPDGDFLDLDFAELPHGKPRGEPGTTPGTKPGTTPTPAPAVLVLHGLEGSTRRHYMLVVYRELLRHGLRPIGLNFRSCSGEPNRLPRFYHSGETGDLRFILQHLAERLPGGIRGAIGFSLGGNVLLKFLGEEGDAARRWLGAAVAISVPFDLAAGADTLERGPMARIYTEYFLRSLRGKVHAKAELLRPLVDLEAALRARTLRRFDDAMTAPLHGFTDAADYYHRSSSAHYLEGIRLPTLLLQAEDDPFLPTSALPRAAVAANPRLVPGFSRRGGHVGFITGAPWAPRFHAEEEAARFLARVEA